MPYYKCEHASQVCIFHPTDVFHTIFEKRTFSFQDLTLPAPIKVTTDALLGLARDSKSLLTPACQIAEATI